MTGPWELGVLEELFDTDEIWAVEKGPGRWEHLCPCCQATLVVTALDDGPALLDCLGEPACEPEAVRGRLEELREMAPQPVERRLAEGEHDLGNARRFLAGAGEHVHYSPGLGWLVWDATHWRADDTGAAERLAKRELELIQKEALRLAAEAGDDLTAQKRAKSRFGWAVKSLQRPKIEAAMRLAQTEHGVPVRAAELDADPLALNVANGIVELASGELRPHERDKLHTKLAPTDYRPDATSARWREFLKHATAGDETLERYLQACAGYSLTGLTSEEAMFLVLGPGATSKTTFTEALKATLGDYAATAAFQTFLAKRDGGPSSDLARLVGRRLVTSSEVGRDSRFNPETVKQLTGGDTITACHKYRDPFEYRPQFKLWLAANHLPAVDHDDDAMWRRLRVVPFEAVVPVARRDPALKRALANDPEERAAVLAWAIEGCLVWQRDGFPDMPERVEGATESYRADNDPLAEWFADCCTFDPEARMSRSTTRKSYEDWCKRNRVESVPARRFAELLRSHGLTDAKSHGERLWQGLAIRRGAVGAEGGTRSGNSPRVRAHGESLSAGGSKCPPCPPGEGQ